MKTKKGKGPDINPLKGVKIKQQEKKRGKAAARTKRKRKEV